MHLQYFCLDDQGRPVPEADKERWARWSQTAVTILSKTTIGDVVVTTTFVGFSAKNPPTFWQTEIRGSLLDSQISECGGDRQTALEQHDTVVRYVQDFLARSKK